MTPAARTRWERWDAIAVVVMMVTGRMCRRGSRPSVVRRPRVAMAVNASGRRVEANHGALVAAAGNMLVTDWHRRILGQTHTAFVYKLGNYTRSVGEHRVILDALAAGSRPAARKALHTHLSRSRADSLLMIRVATGGS